MYISCKYWEWYTVKFFFPQCSSVNIGLRLYHLSVRSLELKIFTCDIRVKWWSSVSLKKLLMFRLILSFIKQTTLRLHTFILVMCCCHCSNYFLLILFYDFIYKQRTKWNKLIAIYVIGEWIVLNFINPHESHYL